MIKSSDSFPFRELFLINYEHIVMKYDMNMKIKKVLSILCLTTASMFPIHSNAQRTTLRDSIQRKMQSISAAQLPTSTSLRSEQMNRYSQVDLDNAKWLRIIYRYLDLSNDKNAPLYYPVQPEEGRTNLFTMIFRLLSDGKITAYEYLDGNEVFTDKYKIKFKEFLDRFSIYNEVQNGKINVSDVDIPSAEVMGYYVKEAYYFESGTSNFGIKTLAICPILVRQGDLDATSTRYPLFWIPYDEIRPFAMRMPIMTSSLNNVMNSTIDDFFRMHEYNGEIYKTLNLQGKAMAQMAPTPEALKAEQQKVEKQLKDFQDHLWKQEKVIPAPLSDKKAKKAKKTTSSTLSEQGKVSMRDRRF